MEGPMMDAHLCCGKIAQHRGLANIKLYTTTKTKFKTSIVEHSQKASKENLD